MIPLINSQFMKKENPFVSNLNSTPDVYNAEFGIIVFFYS